MAVIEIVKKHLVENNFDGLCYEDCGCGIDDLAPCGNITEKCDAAYKHICTSCNYAITCCDNDGRDINGYCFKPEKQSCLK